MILEDCLVWSVWAGCVVCGVSGIVEIRQRDSADVLESSGCGT
jgi:hypothetical protein